MRGISRLFATRCAYFASSSLGSSLYIEEIPRSSSPPGEIAIGIYGSTPASLHAAIISALLKPSILAPYSEAPIEAITIGSTPVSAQAESTAIRIAGNEPDEPTAILSPDSRPIS